MTKAKEGRPAPVGLPGHRARAVRGPDEDGRWYWRGELTTGETFWRGWATPGEASAKVAEYVHTGTVAEDLGTIDRLVRAYLAHREDSSPDLAANTFTGYRLRIRQLRALEVSGYQLALLNAGTMESIRGAMLRRGWKPRTCNGLFGFLAAAWKWGRREGLGPDRDLYVPKVTVKDARKRTPDPDEIEAAIADIHPAWAQIGAKILWDTGCRIGELAALAWDQIDLRRGEIRFTGKTGTRDVPISDMLVAELRAWQAWTPDARLGDRRHAMKRGRSVGILGVTFHTCRVNLKLHLTAACARLDIPRWTAHGFRRAAVDTMQRAKVDIKTAADIMGHTPEVMMKYYRQTSEDDKRSAVRVLGRGSRRQVG